MLIAAGEWWKHLRTIKREFWKAHRRAERREIAKETKTHVTERRETQKEG